MTVRISIITPVLNKFFFISKCIENVISQGTDNIEQIIIDGNSTDGTKEIIENYVTKYDHIRFISETDKGQSDAMNRGIRLAKGEILGILNADDFYSQGTLNSVKIKFTSLTAPTIIFAKCNVIEENGEKIKTYNPRNISLSKILGTKEFPPNPSSYFYHKSLHEIVGLYDSDNHYSMDLEFLLKVIKMNIPIKTVNEVWGNFRLIKGTKTYKNMRSKEGVNEFNKIISRYLHQQPFQQKLIISYYNLISKSRYYLSRII